jgi:AcrR family transcriptional regulator
MPTRARDRLIDTADQLFYAEGVRAVGVERIVSESGVGRASFYRHFASKDDLVVAVLEARDNAYLDWLERTVNALAEDAERKPLAVFDALQQRFARKDFRGCAFINTIVETADPDSPAHRAADHHKKRVIAYLTGLLADSGVERAEDVARQFALLIDGALVTAMREGRPDAADRAKAIAATLLR